MRAKIHRPLAPTAKRAGTQTCSEIGTCLARRESWELKHRQAFTQEQWIVNFFGDKLNSMEDLFFHETATDKERTAIAEQSVNLAAQHAG
jgi:hypothetical protein